MARPPPNKAEILGYKARTGATATEIVDHFWAGQDDATRATAFQRVKKILQRDRAPARQSDPNRPAPTDASLVEGPARPAPDLVRAESKRAAFLTWQLSELLADLAWVRSAGMVGRIASLDARVSEVRQQLDAERGLDERPPLERNPGAVAEAVERRQKRIAQLSEAARAARERDL